MTARVSSTPMGRLPSLSFLKVPEGKVAKNRQVGGGRGEPWDVRWPRVSAAVARLIAAGATWSGRMNWLAGLIMS